MIKNLLETLKAKINKLQKNLEKINIGDYYSTYFAIYEAHLPSVDISVPIILAEINPKNYIGK